MVELQKKMIHRTGSLGSGFAVSRWNTQELIRKAQSQEMLPDPQKNHYPITIWKYNSDISLETITNRLRDHGIVTWLAETIPTNPSSLNAVGLESRPPGGITRIITTVEDTKVQEEFSHLSNILAKLQKEDFTQGEILIPSFSRVGETGFGGGIEIFKGVGTIEEIWNFYRELKDIRAKLWLTHGRFPTLTQLWWGGSHPFQQGEWIGVHNGNIISYDVNTAPLKEKYALLAGTDSEAIPAMIDYLTKTKGLPLEIALLTLKIPGWSQRKRLTAAEQEFINDLSITYDNMLLDGPAALILTNGEKIYALTGRHGVRPLNVVRRPDDGAVLISSEIGPVSPKAIRVSQGKIGTDEHILIYQSGTYVATEIIKTKDILTQTIKDTDLKQPTYLFIDRRGKVNEGTLKKDELRRRIVQEVHQALVQFGCSTGTVRRLEQESRVGAVIIESTGEKKPLPLWRGKDARFLTFFQIGASEVGDPSIDPDRMPIDTITHLGRPEKPYQQVIINSPILFSTRYLPQTWTFFNEVLTKAAETFGTEESLPLEMLSVISTKYTENFETSIKNICQEVENQINCGKSIVVLSDIVINEGNDVIPATLVVSLVDKYLREKGLRHRVSLVVESLEVASSAAVFKTLTLGANAVSIDPRIILAALGIGNFSLDADPLETHQINQEEAHARAHNLFTSWTHQLKKLMGGADITDINNLVSNKLLLQSLGLGEEISSSLGITDDNIGKRNWEFFVRKGILPFYDPDPKFVLPIRLLRHHSPETAISLRKYLQGGPPPEIPRTDYFDLLEFKTDASSEINPQEVSLKTKLYPFSGIERTIKLPLVFGAISLGAAPITFHRILADVAAEQGTFYNTGEGGRPSELRRFLSQDEWTTFQVASGRFGVTMNVLRHSGVIEIKIAQGAKPGIGGHLPGQKVTEIVAQVRGIPVGSSAISPATHQDITSIEDLKALISLLREATDSKTPIQVKLAALPGMAWIAVGAVRCGADALVIDGFRGATGAAPWAQQNEVGLPIASTLAMVDDALRKEGIRDKVSLIAGGGLRTTKEYLMAVALGADAAMTVTSLKDAIGCTQCGQCHTGRCPVGLTAQMGTIFEKRLNYNEGKERLNNYINVLKKDMQIQLAKMGLGSVDELRGRRDLIKLIDEEGTINALDPTVTFKENKDYSFLATPLLQRSWVDSETERIREILLRKTPTLWNSSPDDLDVFDVASAINKLVEIRKTPGLTNSQKQLVEQIFAQTEPKLNLENLNQINQLTQKLELNRVCGCIGECIHRKPTDGMASRLVEEFRSTNQTVLDFTDTPMAGDRYVGVALTRMVDEMRERQPEIIHPIEIKLSGVAGHDLGSFLLPEMTIKVVSKDGQITGAGDGVGKSNQGGTIVVEGNGGDLVGYAMQKGRLYFLGGADDLAGCNLRGIAGIEGPVIVIGGGVKNRAFEGMSGGTAIVIGHNLSDEQELVGENFASGTFGGTIFVHTNGEEIKKHINHNHLENLDITQINPDEEKTLLSELGRWCSEFKVSFEEVIQGQWTKIIPKTINPLANTYTGH